MGIAKQVMMDEEKEQLNRLEELNESSLLSDKEEKESELEELENETEGYREKLEEEKDEEEKEWLRGELEENNEKIEELESDLASIESDLEEVEGIKEDLGINKSFGENDLHDEDNYPDKEYIDELNQKAFEEAQGNFK